MNPGITTGHTYKPLLKTYQQIAGSPLKSVAEYASIKKS
jgi:hypothetical protein